MDVSSPDTSEPAPKTDKGISRRTFLKGVAAATASVVTAAVVGPPVLDALTKLNQTSAMARDNDDNNPPPQLQTDAVNENKDSDKSELYSFLENHPLLINLSADQKHIVETWVLNQINHYKRGGDRAENSGKRQSLVDKIASERGFKLDSFTRRILTGLIFVESEGDPYKVSSGGAKGLCQLMPSTAGRLAEEFDIDLGKNQVRLFEPEINIALALEHIHKLFELFPDPTLAVWAYHLGETNLANCLHAYFTEGETDERIKEIDKDFADIWSAATASYVSGKKTGKIINIVDLLTSQSVQKILIEGLLRTGKKVTVEDDTQYYVTRVLAGEYLIRSSQTKA